MNDISEKYMILVQSRSRSQLKASLTRKQIKDGYITTTTSLANALNHKADSSSRITVSADIASFEDADEYEVESNEKENKKEIENAS